MSNTLVRMKCAVCGKVAREAYRTELHRTVPQVWERDDSDMEALSVLAPANPHHEREFTCMVDEVYGVMIHLECGHGIERELEKADESVEIVSHDGRTPFQFQWDTTEFIEAAGCEGLILHEQGLGKTICACMILKRNKKHVLPCLYVCKSGLREQVFSEIIRWTDIVPQMITASNQVPLLDWFPITLVSIDMLRLVRPDIANNLDDDPMPTPKKKGKKAAAGNPKWTDELLGKYKLVIMDESQKIKNPASSRTQAFRKIVKLGNGGNKAKVICMSGTNIEKHAGEYFVTLNVVRPELFPHQNEFEYRHCYINPDNGKPGGLKRPEQFRELTKDFIIRYRREEVLPDLPRVFRQMKRVVLEDSDVLKHYLKVVSDFQEYMLDEARKKTPIDILGYMQKMRHWTGVAKVPAALEYLEEFLLENDDDRKIVVFLHHKEAGAELMARVTKLCTDAHYAPPLYLNADLNLKQRTACVDQFRQPGNRIMLASTLAAGEGLNLQFCSDCLIMERQFNPSIEEQAEGRFPRPGSTADKINAVYLIAIGTIDDFLTTLVEEKRRNVRGTLDYQEVTWEESNLMHELAEALMENGLAAWKLSA